MSRKFAIHLPRIKPWVDRDGKKYTPPTACGTYMSATFLAAWPKRLAVSWRCERSFEPRSGSLASGQWREADEEHVTPQHREKLRTRLGELAHAIGGLVRDVAIVDRDLGPEVSQPLRRVLDERIREANALADLLAGPLREASQTRAGDAEGPSR